MIPNNIRREHILQAIEEIDINGVPDVRKSTNYLLEYEEKQYPPKFVISIANRYANGEELDSNSFSGGSESNKFLYRLGFKIVDRDNITVTRHHVPIRVKQKTVIAETQQIEIPAIELGWSPWYEWNDVALLQRDGGISVPSHSGVYEAKIADEEERLTIGKASSLYSRVKQGLVRDKVPHSAGDKIRAHEDTAQVVVRWAITDRPAAVEEELHQAHILKFGGLPKHVDHT